MPIYLFAYHGSRIPNVATEKNELASAWKAWMEQLGAALEGSNNPVNIARTVNSDASINAGGGANPVVGLSFITAERIEAALDLARTCPHLAAGGSIEVAELIPDSSHRRAQGE